ncbi:hypothetical protein V7024_19290 [Bacillus sp. JJ864]|uniref:hypothetical protein n=1 Tax=Bacillus sp. JJ864 TaxID=3122975 RepID=UPI0030002C85
MAIIGLLGTVHTDDLRQKLKYPLHLMEDVIRTFQPNTILGEVRPEDYKRYLENRNFEGYLGPSEYRSLILPLCESEGISFVPVDWFDEEITSLNYFSVYNEDMQNQLENELYEIYEDISQVAVLDPISLNSHMTNEMIKKKQLWLEEKNHAVHEIVWSKRNKRIIDNIIKHVISNEKERILITIGAEHCYYIQEELSKLGIDVIFPIDVKKR